MRTYVELFRVPQFGALFTGVSLKVAAGTMSGIAVGSLVYGRTGSPLLSALAMFGASFAQLLGAVTLLSMADRVRPRSTLLWMGGAYAAAALALAIPNIPIWVLLLIEFAIGLVSAAGAGVQWGLVNEILPAGGYILGRSVFNMAVGVMQIVGFALGGILIAVASARGALLLAAGLYVVSSLVIRLFLTERPTRATGRASIRLTWTVNATLWSDPRRRVVFLALWVPNGLIVGCEALFVPYAPTWSGALFVASALGMLVGDTAVGRFIPETWRPRLASPLRLLLAVPYVLFALGLPAPLAVLAVAVASIGYGAGLLLQERLLAVTSPDLRGQALGLHSAGMLTMQAVGATLAGAVAELVSPAATITMLAVASVIVTLTLTPRLLRVDALAGDEQPEQTEQPEQRDPLAGEQRDTLAGEQRDTVVGLAGS